MPTAFVASLLKAWVMAICALISRCTLPASKIGLIPVSASVLLTAVLAAMLLMPLALVLLASPLSLPMPTPVPFRLAVLPL